MSLFSKKPKAKPIHIGRASEVSTSRMEYSPFRTKGTKLLNRLRSTYDVYDAIDLLVKEHPDTSMGYTVLQSLVNQRRWKTATHSMRLPNTRPR